MDARILRREHVEAYIEDVLARCRPATASVRYRALARFFTYLVEEGEVRESPMARMKPPLVPEEPVAVLGDEALRQLLAACEGRGFEERRDMAIVRLVPRQRHAAGRAGEPADRRSRPGTGRGHRRRQGPAPTACPSGPRGARRSTGTSGMWSRHHAAAEPWLWIGKRGRMNDSGVYQMIVRRAAQAGLESIRISSGTPSPPRGCAKAARAGTEAAWT